jgi:MYXO-CTERM domain-containing protein
MKREFCAAGTCRVQQQSTYYGYKKRAVCDNVHEGFGVHEGSGEIPGGIWLDNDIGPGYGGSAGPYGSDPDCEWKAVVCKQFPGTMCTLTEIGPPPSYSKWPQTGWRCRNLDGGSSYSPGSSYNPGNSYSPGNSYNPSKPGVGDICYPGQGSAYTCVDVTRQIFPNGTSNPCFGAQPGDPRIVVNKCMGGDHTVRCCLLLPRQGFGMADDLGGQEIASGEGTIGGCSVSAGPGAGAPGLALLLLLGLVACTRRS